MTLRKWINLNLGLKSNAMFFVSALYNIYPIKTTMSFPDEDYVSSENDKLKWGELIYTRSCNRFVHVLFVLPR